jgi:hypothetical protein
MGVIYVPVADTLYFSDLELGAFKIDSCQTAGIHEENAIGMDNLESLVEKRPGCRLKRTKTVHLRSWEAAPTRHRNWKHTLKPCGSNTAGWISFRRAVP